MKIYKAFLISLLLLLLDGVLVTGVFYLLEKNFELNDGIFLQIIESVSLLSFVLSYILVFKIFGLKNGFKNVAEKIKALKAEPLLYLIIISIGLHWLERPLFDYQKIIDSYSNIQAVPYYQSPISWLFSYSAVKVIILAPILEELLFRKYIFSGLLKNHSFVVSAGISSLCFALIHIPNYQNLLPTFFFGIIACLIYNKTKNILYPIVLHFLSNLLWTILILFGEQYYGWIYNLNFDFTYWAIFIFGILLTWLGLKQFLLNDIKSIDYHD